MTTSMELNRELENMADDLLAKENNAAMGVVPETALVRPSKPVAFRSTDSAAFPEHERNVAMGVHIGTLAATLLSGGLFVPLLVPVIGKLVFKDSSPALQEHIRQQLNFQLTMAIVAVVGIAATVVTFGIGVFALIPALLFFLGVEVVGSIKGAIAAQNGEDYAFPFTLNVVKPAAPEPRRLR